MPPAGSSVQSTPRCSYRGLRLFVVAVVVGLASVVVSAPLGTSLQSAVLELVHTRTPLADDETVCLEPCVRPGALSMATSPWTEVFIDGARIGTTPLFRQRLLPGVHELRMVNRTQGIETSHVISIEQATSHKLHARLGHWPLARMPVARTEAKSDQRLAVDCARDLLTPAHVTIATTPWTQVYLDGRLLGVTPLFKEPVAPGRHMLELRNDVVGVSLTRAIDLEVGDLLKLTHSF